MADESQLSLVFPLQGGLILDNQHTMDPGMAYGYKTLSQTPKAVIEE